MKKAAAIIVVIFVTLGLAWSGFCIVDDAIHHRGYNWQTTSEYRQVLSEGKNN